MHFKEGVSKNFEGATVIRAKLGPALKRGDLEKKVLLPGVQVGLPGFERAHSQGPGTGHESIHGICYAPRSVNQGLQRLGIESKLRQLVKETPPGLELWLTTETLTHKGTDQLKEINYQVNALKPGGDVDPSKRRILFEASIEVDRDTVNPRVKIEATPLAMRF